ncbi:hypothetical protein DAMA08_039930 [Martiniozyma asiatica (nom. inval.)]|nr:hypothetical protein DAMA08_039930 [Martiniozyma asiatica]
MPPKLIPGFFFDDESGKYYSIPKSGSDPKNIRERYEKYKNRDMAQKSHSNQSEPEQKINNNSELIKFMNENTIRDDSLNKLRFILDPDEAFLRGLTHHLDICPYRNYTVQRISTFNFRDPILGIKFMKMPIEYDEENHSDDGNYNNDKFAGGFFEILVKSETHLYSRWEFSQNISDLVLISDDEEMRNGVKIDQIDSFIPYFEGLLSPQEKIPYGRLLKALKIKKTTKWLFNGEPYLNSSSDITAVSHNFLSNKHYIAFTFRDGLIVLIIYDSQTSNFKYIFHKTSNTICDIIVMEFHGEIYCIVSHIGNQLDSYKFNQFEKKLDHFRTYNGYKNTEKLSRNMKFPQKSAFGNDSGVFAIESELPLTHECEIKFYMLLYVDPMKGDPILLPDTENTPILWGYKNDSLLLANLRTSSLTEFRVTFV